MLERYSTDLVAQARELCLVAHAEQQRDSGEPFSAHPIAVVEILRSFHVEDSETLAAGYLHDVLEDTPVSMDQLAAGFGPRIAATVDELTNKGRPGRTRSEKQQALIKKARAMSDKAKLIKLADRLHNLSTIPL